MTAYIAYLPALIIIAALAIGAIVVHRRIMAARAAVNAECLACTYREQFADVRTARAAGNMHGDKTGHPLILVLAGNGPA